MTMSALVFFGDDDLDALARATAEKITRKRREALDEEAAGLIYRWITGRRGDSSFNVEDYWAENSDEPALCNLKIKCSCGRQFFPFCSPTLTCIGGGWRWVGLDHQEPYGEYFAVCGWCATPVTFSTYCPQ